MIITSFTDETPEYKLVFEEHPDYFFACVEAELVSPKIMESYQARIAHQISIRRYNRVMIKRDVPITETRAELCQLIYKVKNWDFRNIKYVFVDVDPRNLDAYQFALLYARSRGVEIEIFDNIDQARDWLLSEAVLIDENKKGQAC
jgi:hypothetical protein